MLSQAAMAPALFVLGASGFTLYPVAMAWACEKVEHHQLVAMNQALLMKLYHRQPAGPDPDGDADAELLRQPAVYHDRQRVVYLSADPAAQSRASSDASGARLTLQRAADALRVISTIA